MVAVDTSTSPKLGPGKHTVQPVGKKIKSFFTKCFAKVCLMRIFAKLNKSIPSTLRLRASRSKRSWRNIQINLWIATLKLRLSWSGCLGHRFGRKKGFGFTPRTVKLTHQYVLLEPVLGSGEREVVSKVDPDIRSNAWVFGPI